MDDALPADLEARRFVEAIGRYQKEQNVAHPTCEDLVDVLHSLGYSRLDDGKSVTAEGLPIDRRRREEDDRKSRTERRSSLEPSAQERLELSDEEHQFLDALRDLRDTTGRDFASSEELLSILWNIGYRPTSEEGLPCVWLDDEERCRFQMAFTHAVEERLSAEEDTDFLTCRSIMEIVAEQGFVRNV